MTSPNPDYDYIGFIGHSIHDTTDDTPTPTPTTTKPLADVKRQAVDDGGPAFPQNDATVNRINNLDGMSLRDYFAAKAMAGLLAGFYADKPSANLSEVPKESFLIADAMLAARKA